MPLFAAVEGGGTSWVVVITKDEPDNVLEREVFPTETPDVTLKNIRVWLNARSFDAIGVACFGPVDAKIGSSTHGFITSTPKPNWAHTDVLGGVGCRDEFKDIPCWFDTDVNAPALAEYCYHHKAGTTSCAYITIGTGIGVGLVANGKTGIYVQ